MTDGRTLGMPLAWFPRLLCATPAERERVELSPVGLHWEALDEDISIAGLLAGRRDVTRSTKPLVIERDAHSGKLDTLADKALAAHRAGRSRDL